MATLTIHTAPNGVLAAVMPLGFAAARRTALVIDLDPEGVPLPGTTTLRDLVERGPSADELSPQRSGIACLPNGGVTGADASEVVTALVDGWPATVVRVGAESPEHLGRGIGVRPVLPGLALPTLFTPVLQPTGLAPTPDHLPGLVLPRLPGRVARGLLHGRAISGHWLRSCAQVWDL